jgi:hypothetical protein
VLSYEVLAADVQADSIVDSVVAAVPLPELADRAA